MNLVNMRLLILVGLLERKMRLRKGGCYSILGELRGLRQKSHIVTTQGPGH
jgi:hypothetical protein